MTQVNHLIEIRGLKKSYQSGTIKVEAIRQMDLCIDDGEFITIMGQSGSGKSTLLSVIGALNRPVEGQVLVDSLDIYSLSAEQRADFRSEYIGFIFQSFQLIPYLTVLENVQLPMTVTGHNKKDQDRLALAVLDRVGLSDKAYRLPDRLSGGEQERVAIARAIVNKPPIILADEPTGNLDSKNAHDIMQLLQTLNRKGHTVIVVSHNPDMQKYSTRNIQVCDGILCAI
jgi:putative ABC transport system ATP-binding protein